MTHAYLRHLIREILQEKKKPALITEPEAIEEEEQNEYSAGGVAGAHAVGHRPKKKNRK